MEGYLRGLEDQQRSLHGDFGQCSLRGQLKLANREASYLMVCPISPSEVAASLSVTTRTWLVRVPKQGSIKINSKFILYWRQTLCGSIAHSFPCLFWRRQKESGRHEDAAASVVCFHYLSWPCAEEFLSFLAPAEISMAHYFEHCCSQTLTFCVVGEEREGEDSHENTVWAKELCLDLSSLSPQLIQVIFSPVKNQP